MKSRKITYLLITVLIVVWGVIIHQIAAYTLSETVPVPIGTSKTVVAEDTSHYDLMLNYSDPFLQSANLQVTQNRIIAEKEAVVTESQAPQMPNMKFKGVIKQSGKLYAIIEFGSHSEILRQGETTDDYRITNINEDSVILKKQQYTFVLKPK